MKKLFLLMMALIAIAPIAFTSCGDDEEGSNKDDNNVTLKTPAFKKDAAKYNIKPTVIAEKHIVAQSIELTESGHYIIIGTPISGSANTRAGGEEEYLTGNYTKSGEGYQLGDFGWIAIESETMMTIIPTGGNSIEVSYTKQSQQSSATMTDYLCRTWTVQKTQLRMKVNGATVGREFQGECNMNEIIAYAKDNGANIKDELKPNTIITGVTFTTSGTFMITYKNGKIDAGTWSWSSMSNGEISYKWNSSDMGYSIEIGKAAVGFSGNNCRFGLYGKVNGEEMELTFTLKS